MTEHGRPAGAPDEDEAGVPAGRAPLGGVRLSVPAIRSPVRRFRTSHVCQHATGEPDTTDITSRAERSGAGRRAHGPATSSDVSDAASANFLWC